MNNSNKTWKQAFAEVNAMHLRALEKQEERSALQDNAQKNKEIEKATKSNIGDLIKAELGESQDQDEQV